MQVCRESEDEIDDETRATRQVADSNWTRMRLGRVEATMGVRRVGGDDYGY